MTFFWYPQQSTAFDYFVAEFGFATFVDFDAGVFDDASGGGELAASEVTLRTFQEIQQYLDGGTRALLDALRMAGEDDRSFRKSQMDAAIKFCGKAFGQDYAALLAKAAETAGGAERKVAAKV